MSKPAAHRLQRTAAAPLRVRGSLAEMRDNCSSTSPAPPLRLIQTVSQPGMFLTFKNMKHNPYSKYNGNDLILRDELAIDRTLLANERTLLAYLRFGVALIIAGVSIMNFSQQKWFWLIGVTCIPIGVITAIIGLVHYRRMSNAIALVRSNKTGTESSSEPASSAHVDTE